MAEVLELLRRRATGWGWLALLCLPVAHARPSTLFEIPPLQPPRTIGADWFGTHFHRLGQAAGGLPATPWPDKLVGSLRLWDSGTRWADLEAAPDRFEFARLDAIVDTARAHGASVTMVLGSPAPWAAARPREDGPYGPGSASEPRDLARWDRYVGALAHRYRGRIARYELWNEPYFSDLRNDRGQPGAFFTGSAATMVELARVARAALRREDPQAQLLTPGFVGAPYRLELYLKAGGGRYADGVAYHFYVDQDDAEFVQLVASVRATMARGDLAGRPLLNTESGFAIRGVEGQPVPRGLAPIDRHRAAALLVRQMILAAWLGLEQFDHYAWDNGRMGMVMSDGRTATDTLRAWTAVRGWLLGTTPEGCRPIDGRGMRCEGWRGDERVVIAWKIVGDAPLALAADPARRVVAVEHAIDGTLPPPAAGAASLALPTDGMPLAVWTRAAADPRHTHVMQSR